MPPVARPLPSFVAEPPQEGPPYGRWAERLERELRAAWAALDAGEADVGEPGEILWYPDRTWHGRRYVPATAPTSGGCELYGYVRYLTGLEQQSEPLELLARGDFTDQTAARHPEWKLDVCDEVVGAWRGGEGQMAAMTLVWGRALIGGGRVITGELGPATVDQCALVDERFTLLAPDDYRGDLLELRLWGARGQELARESLYE